MKDQRKVNTIKLMADSNRNGNPQRGWLVMTQAGELLSVSYTHLTLPTIYSV